MYRSVILAFLLSVAYAKNDCIMGGQACDPYSMKLPCCNGGDGLPMPCKDMSNGHIGAVCADTNDTAVSAGGMLTCGVCEAVCKAVQIAVKEGNSTTTALEAIVKALCKVTAILPIQKKECDAILNDIDKIKNWIAQGLEPKQVCVILGFCANSTVIEQNTLHAPAAANATCLTPAQQKALKTAVTSIKAVLITATTALRIAALAEKNTTIKKDLWEAATVTSAVNQQLVSQLEKIANESCGTCEQIATAVNDAIDAIENTLAKIDPEWKNNPIFKDVVAAIQAIVNLIKAICPSQAQ